jgi:hypothetical protein
MGVKIVTILMLLGPNLAPAVAAHVYVDRQEVADRIFPSLSVIPVALGGERYETRIILRFTDPDSEIVIKTHAKGRKTVDLYSLAPGLSIEGETGRVQRQNPNATAQQVAVTIHVRKTSLAVSSNQVDRWLQALGSLSPPLTLELWVKFDSLSRFDFWADSNGDFVHYSMSNYAAGGRTATTHENPLTPLARWMLQVRSEAEELYNKSE